MNKKGFFFTVMALILISFIFISIQLWAQSTQVQEQRYAEKFKTYAMQNAISMSSEETFSKFANASMIYAVNKFATNLENHSSLNVRGVYDNRKASDPEGIFYLNKSIYELMIYGNTSGYLTDSANTYPPNEYFYMDRKENLVYSDSEMRYTLGNYFKTTSEAAALIGYNLSWGEPTNFTFNQSDRWTIYVSFSVPLNLSDSENRLHTSKNLTVNASFDINGLTDPYVAREHVSYLGSQAIIDISDQAHNIPKRNIYRIPKYEDREDAKANVIKNGTEGMGWFFGPAVWSGDYSKFLAEDDYRYNLSKIGTYILITPDAGFALEHSGEFGAVILLRPSVNNPSLWPNITGEIELRQTPKCSFKLRRQPTCLFCIETYVEEPGSDCSGIDIPTLYPYLLESKYAEDTIPYNVNMPYIAIDSDKDIKLGSGTYSDTRGHWNYHLKLPEYLLQNK